MQQVRRAWWWGHGLVLGLVLIPTACGTPATTSTPRELSSTERAVAGLAGLPGGTFTSEVRLTGSTVTDRGKFRTDPPAVAFTRVLDVPGNGSTLKFRAVGDEAWLLIARSGDVRTPKNERCWLHAGAPELATGTGLDAGVAGNGLPAAVVVALNAQAGPGTRTTSELYPVAQMLGTRFAAALGVGADSSDRVELDLQVVDGTVTGWSTSVGDIAAATEALGGVAAGAEGTIVATIAAMDREPRVVPPPPARTVELSAGPDPLAEAGSACAAR